MNFKAIVVVAASLSAVASFGIEYRQLTKEDIDLIRADAQKLSPADRAKRAEAVRLDRLLREGGRLTMPGTPKGTIRIVNLQKRVASADLKSVKNVFGSFKPYDIEIVDADCKAELKITLIDDAKTPSLSLYPDEGYSFINVAKLVDEKTAEKPAFLIARVRKEIVRAYAYMTAGSTYGKPIFNRMAKPSDLDECASERLPMDISARASKYLENVGVVPAENISYKLALKRGFNLTPTNQFQKAIYDKFMSEKERGPVNGIKIAPPKAKK